MSDILLVHGSCHGAWCWRDLEPALTALGHTARSIDMPSHGADPTPPEQVTLDSCAQSVVDALGRDTVVVGHSWGGFPISRAADMALGFRRRKIARLIYLCAYAPWDGHSLADMRRAAPRQPLKHAIVKSADSISFGIDPAYVRDVFYHDCPAGTLEYALPRLSHQPIKPQETPVALGPGHAAAPKSYIRCNDDRTIPSEFQITMTKDWPASDIFEMSTGHSPFFADPAGLATLIDRIVRA
ncbi:alpha/beta fold hydrolase [Shimia abyssi]|uniref:Pimeloyl-ACP methyl ester carboxylesterase n=1 Tax=Shimia abyssi TaxID=1662395 RepID=A0A2P8FE63_9RHOB|nr:alpha/beta fold hydrolase [Shimia abyssi]PSL19994.1 pimeloyl-ACP methyl ester carboxylesterase [Shimia abyssi]